MKHPTQDERAALRVARGALGTLVAACGLYLLFGPKPWNVPGGPAFFDAGHEYLGYVSRRALWWCALVNAGLGTLLLATARWWTAPLAPAAAALPRPPRWFAPCIIAALLLGAGLRWNLAQSGLWWDEAWLVDHVIVGHFEPEPSLGGVGPPRLVPVSWAKTLWSYRKATNHIPQTAASRLSVDIWRASTGHLPQEFDELALRLPTLAAALTSIVLLGLLVREWGFPRAGVAAAFLLALHPWHIELATAARGYSFVLWASVAGGLTLTKALRTGAWRWWLAFGATQVLLLWTYPFAVYVAASLAIAALVSLAIARRGGEARRLVAVHVLVAMALLLVMGPALAQILHWREYHDAELQRAAGNLKLLSELARDTAARVTAGVPYRVSPSAEPVHPSLHAVLMAHDPWLAPVVFVLLPAVSLVGLAIALRRPGPHRPVVAALALAPVVAVAASALQDQVGRRFHPRFIFFVLAAALPGLAIALDAAAERLRGRTRAAWVAPFALAGAVVALQLPATRVMTVLPYSGMRDAVDFVRRRPDAALALRTQLGGENVWVYDPGLVHIGRASDLRVACKRARLWGRPLYLLYRSSDLGGMVHPATFRLLGDRRFFDPLAQFDAIAPQASYQVVRYTGEPLPGKARQPGRRQRRGTPRALPLPPPPPTVP